MDSFNATHQISFLVTRKALLTSRTYSAPMILAAAATMKRKSQMEKTKKAFGVSHSWNLSVVEKLGLT